MRLINRKIELAVAAKHDPREALKSVYYDAPERALVAVNGYMVAKLAVTPHADDESALICADTIKEARKAGTGPLADRELNINTKEGRATLIDGSSHPVKDMSYPNYKRTIPDENREHKVEIGLNAALLSKLAQALCRSGDQRIVLSIAGPDDAVLVYAVEPVDPDDVGVIMPIRL